MSAEHRSAGPIGRDVRTLASEHGATILVGNEFASVVVTAERGAGVDRLLLRDVTSGHARYIDPLVLEALIHMSEAEMDRLADPNLLIVTD